MHPDYHAQLPPAAHWRRRMFHAVCEEVWVCEGVRGEGQEPSADGRHTTGKSSTGGRARSRRAKKKDQSEARKGEPWYRKFNDTWYIDYNGKQVSIKDDEGGNVKEADNEEGGQRCWVMMKARMLGPGEGRRQPPADGVRPVPRPRREEPPRTPSLLTGARSSRSPTACAAGSSSWDLTAFNVDRVARPERRVGQHHEGEAYITIILAALNWAAEPTVGSSPPSRSAATRSRAGGAAGAEALVIQGGARHLPRPRA